MPPRARSHGSSAERQRRERSLLFPFDFFCSWLLLRVLVICWRRSSVRGNAAAKVDMQVDLTHMLCEVLLLPPLRCSVLCLLGRPLMDVCVPSWLVFLAYNPDLLLFWVVSEALASLYRKSLEGRRVYVLHPL